MAKLKLKRVLLATMLLTCGLMAVCQPALVADEAEKAKQAAVKKDLEQLQGTWLCIGLEINGKRIEGKAYREKYGPNPIRIERNKLSIGAKKKIVCTFTLDPTKKPKWMDSTRDSDGRKFVGIYELKGQRLMLYDSGGKRPTAFRTKEGSNDVFHIYEKVRE